MIYFEYPLDIHGWKPKSETKPETKPKPELENRGQKTNPEPETRKTETRGYPHRTRSAAISTAAAVAARAAGGPRRGGWGVEEARREQLQVSSVHRPPAPRIELRCFKFAAPCHR